MTISCVLVLAIVWILLTVFRKPKPIEELLNEVELNLAARLYPFIELRGPARFMDDDELWKAIGGINGIFLIHKESRVFVSLAIKIAKAYPEDAKNFAEEILCSAVYLRLTTWACLVEFMLRRIMPRLPRIQARSAAKLYCDIAMTIETVLSVCEPGLSVRI